ncbi:DUF2325 domain-containing protein [Ideonella margarita]|uniref:DUF2325 domain-containing protein n=1 Tax=Ideonella margarita TaxID=2984191 RepID=A0ABU9CAN5_9BURK
MHTQSPHASAEPDGPYLASAVRLACCPTGSNPVPGTQVHGSRRRKLWELPVHAHCPVVGVCLPMEAVRQLVNKTVGDVGDASDHALHCGVNAECKQRSRVSEAVHKELDRRYALPLQQAKALKCTHTLTAHWRQMRGQGSAVAGALWAVLTHPRCDPVLETEVLQDIHMLQHQLGAADRADHARIRALLHENAVVARALASAQQRCTRLSEQHAQALAALQAEQVTLRGALIARTSELAQLQQAHAQLKATLPDLDSRLALKQQLAMQQERNQALQQTLSQLRMAHERLVAETDPPRAEPRAEQPVQKDAPVPVAAPTPTRWQDRAVLCVGGRPGAIPIYRELVEQAGGHFLHHDGGEQELLAKLDSTLAAADLVICQTGCISHNAYWRVKDHCKRTGKPCVYVDKPSASRLKRVLLEPSAPVAQSAQRSIASSRQ